ncbi:PREDICTED: uncharacterized protein LOC105452115 [Wasmannia auropunctata]|uniref:uncharacterized protein LOC105452115 n=1 Tax=Wasmannia auropunctata TaxID=64793 RepID=UPI0005EF340A|nr:PREDICTED: uncharacterized protein LOC105452115 [Wasmannia auropunctata]
MAMMKIVSVKITIVIIFVSFLIVIDSKMRLEEDLVIRRSRPTMISAKYRAREERRRLLKISAGKLRRIEDPEASLCRSVLINNAVRRLQRENRDEKTRSYGTLPVVASYMDASKENNIAENLIADVTDEETSSRKRYDIGPE